MTFICTFAKNSYTTMNPKNKPIVIWLLSGCFLITLMVILGGITRLTHSGLSIVNWTLHGSLPPTTHAAWEHLFNLYKQHPEYKDINVFKGFTLADFKSIFWWEYIHRMLGRFIGIVFIVPFLFFLFTKRIGKVLMPKLLLLFLLGGLQGLIGWYMVYSGLINRPDVSHYRLALHLITAFITFSLTFWVALGLIYENNKPPRYKKIRNWVWVLLPVLFIQIMYGAFVAGLDAGFVYNTWPKMGNQWIADAVTKLHPLWKNFVDSVGGVQFMHRYIAYIVVAIIATIWFKARKLDLSKSQIRGVNFLGIMVLVQFTLGVCTLVFHVPIVLGVLHQLGAFTLLAATVFTLQRFSPNAVF